MVGLTEYYPASYNRGTTGMYVTGGMAALQNRITALKNRMKPNLKVTAADFNELVAIYNRWKDHYHGHNDLRGIDTFGNWPVYGGSGTYIWRYTSAASGSGNSGANVIVGDNIAVGDVNNIILYINAIRSHNHSTTDYTS